MLWIGLTGCMGCGKTSLAHFFKDQGHPLLSADEIVKKLYNRDDVCSTIKSKLGLSQSLNSGELIQELAKSVFKNKEKLEKLENILHPLIREEVKRFKKTLPSNAVAFYDVPLLFEKSMESQFDYIVTVGTRPDLQKERLKKRNNWSESEIEERLKQQFSIDYKRVNSDFFIWNNGDLESLHKKARSVLEALVQISCF